LGCGEDDVSALDISRHVAAPDICEDLGEVRHGQLVFATHVDAAKQGDVGTLSHVAGVYLKLEFLGT
jgi:hypothetical protein